MTIEKADGYLREGYGMMAEFGFPPPTASERNAVPARALKTLAGSANAAEIAAALQAFFVSRKLFDTNEGDDRARVLLADYFVALSVRLLAPLCDERIVGRLSDRLKSEAAGGASLSDKLDPDKYLDWTSRICEEFLNSEKQS
jgi:hypothetical protein